MDHFKALKNNEGKTQAPVAKSQLEETIDEADQFLPDSWIPRSSALIRLTGQHPLNAEADLTELFDAGLVTPTRLHYVRNHGKVPVLDWDTHKLEVFSDQDSTMQSRSFSMQELADMEDWINVPVALACDGNRRGEVNMIKRSKGFSWGSGAISCAYWRGVPVRNLLMRCGLQDHESIARWYLHYEGADDPSEGKYATSIPLAYAMSEVNDVMIAYQMNDLPLHPDHGYPIRSIIPGFVGGRQVKWLSKLWISDKPSTNHYHIYDNRVLPEYVTENESDIARAYYHHPDTACNEQNLNSVICKPTHGEQFHLDDSTMWASTYRLAGYAYEGGGVAIQKVEVSLDEGKTWKYAFRRYPDNPLRHGHKWWTWLHWHLDVPMRDVLRCSAISVRAWNVFKNTQPEHITWNLMGMMNNAIHTVKPHFELVQDRPTLSFEHPTQPGPREGGWMRMSPEEKIKASSSSSKQSQKEFTLEEIQKHSTKDDAWIVLDGQVYDVTSVLDWHPGGASAILGHAGKGEVETTMEYSSIHDGYANSKRDECLIGKVSNKGLEAMKKEAVEANQRREQEIEARQPFSIKKHRWAAIKLKKRIEISEDTRIYRFALPETDDGHSGKLGLPIGNHVAIGAHFQDAMVVRHYTPIRPILPQEEDGTIDLLVKVYYPAEGAKFPPGGTIGNYLDSMQEGEEIDCRGPLGDIKYIDKGKFNINGEDKHFKKINLIAGGSGITPHYQLIHAICKNPDDKTQISLIDCDSKRNDILLFDELQELANNHSDKLKLWVILSHPDEGLEWKYGTGHLNEEQIKEHLFPASEDTATFLCGPPTLIEKAAKPGLAKLGHAEERIFGF